MSAVEIERLEWGNMYGFIRRVEAGGKELAIGDADGWETLQPLLKQTEAVNQRIHRLEKDEIGEVNHKLEKMQRRIKALQAAGDKPQELAAAEAETGDFETATGTLREAIDKAGTLDLPEVLESWGALLAELEAARPLRVGPLP